MPRIDFSLEKVEYVQVLCHKIVMTIHTQFGIKC